MQLFCSFAFSAVKAELISFNELLISVIWSRSGLRDVREFSFGFPRLQQTPPLSVWLWLAWTAGVTVAHACTGNVFANPE